MSLLLQQDAQRIDYNRLQRLFVYLIFSNRNESLLKRRLSCFIRMLQKMPRMGKDFRYYFQHPWSRIVIAYLVTFFNFLIFAEDPVSHSQTEANVIVVGNCFSFIMTKYPGGAWNFLKVLLWLIAIIVGLVAGKFLFHQRLFGK